MLKTLNIGLNKQQRRLWLEGPLLTDNGWTRGTHYTREILEGGNNAKIKLVKNPAGKLKVAGTDTRPIIDVAGKWLSLLVHGGLVDLNATPQAVIEFGDNILIEILP